jgi:hypothetical protein
MSPFGVPMNETTYRNLLQIELSKAGLRAFRNNTGVFFTEQGIPTRAGLCKGSGDLIGWIPAGWSDNRQAVFLSIETKTGTGRVRPEQESWLQAVNAAGGVAIIARPGDDVVKMIRDLLTSK